MEPEVNVQKIYKDQRNFFDLLETQDLSKRLNLLKRLQTLLIDHEQNLMEAIHLDFGKSDFETFTTELMLVHQEIRFYLKNLRKLSKPQKVKSNLANFPAKSIIVSEPLGVCLIIGAWNYPIQVLLMPAVAALAAGNTVILKPSEFAPHTAQVIQHMISKNFPTNWLHVVQGNAEVVQKLLLEKFDHVFFTGSTAVGKIIYQMAAQNLTPVTLELGGKSPVIVTESADLDIAARRIIWGKFLNAGQTCIAPDHLYIQDSVYENLLPKLKEQLIKTDYSSGSTQYTKIITHTHWNRLHKLLKSENTTIYFGGHSDASNLYIEPTLVELQNEEHPLMKEEIFGPILPILRFKNLDVLWQNLRKKEKPLAAYLFTTNPIEKKHFEKKFSFGGGCINDTLMHITNSKLPFGGIGESGIGNYHGIFGWQTFTHRKPILKKPNWGESTLKYPPYSSEKLAWIKKLWKWL